MDAFFDWRWGIIKKKMTLGIKSAILWKKILIVKSWGITFHRCSLLVENYSLLVTRCKITRYSLQILLVTCCRSCSLQKITRYSLQNLLVTRCRSCSLQKVSGYLLQNLLVTRCRSGVSLCNFFKEWLQHRCFPVNF